MCHWVLRMWKCGDSFFTKYSSCSFDRAIHDPNHLLNPLHPSVVPVKGDKARLQASDKPRAGPNGKSGVSTTKGSTADKSDGIDSCPLPKAIVSPMEVLAPRHAGAATKANETPTLHVHDGTGRVIPVPLSEVGKASRFGDAVLAGSTKCNVFEVVLQSREPTVCPACARNPKRARLPAHARGCFGAS